MQRRLAFVTLLVLVAVANASRSVQADAAPAAASLCTQQPDGATCATVMEAVVAELPAPPAILAMVQFTINPGVQFTDLSVPGPALLLVETGTLTVDMSGETDEADQLEEMEGFVARASVNGTPRPTTGSVHVASVGIFRVTLQAGDRLLIPADWPHAMRNDTASPVSILAVAVTPPEPETGGPAWPPAGAWPPGLPDGVKVRPLDAGYRATTDLPHSDAAEILVERVTLQSGMSMEFGSEAARLLTVQKGVLSVRCAAACPVRYRSPASTVTASPSPIASATGADRMTLLAGESVLIPANVHATITTEETGSSEPSSFLATTVIPSNKNPGKQGVH